jgi:hypothetical protein
MLQQTLQSAASLHCGMMRVHSLECVVRRIACTAGHEVWAVGCALPAAVCPGLHAALAGQDTGPGLVQLKDPSGKVWQVLWGNMTMAQQKQQVFVNQYQVLTI